MAVNVSARDLHASTLAETVADGLARHGLPASALRLELTERVLMADPARVADTLAALERLGVRLSLDDFGTGYSSLVLLQRLPVSEIKVDRSFVKRLIARPRTTPRSSARSSTSRTRSASRRWPRAWRPRRSGTCSRTSAATAPRAGT